MPDVALAVRSLLRTPGHTGLVVVCLAIGLTINIVAFSVAHALMYGELPGITSRSAVLRLSLQHKTVFGAETVGGQVVAAGPMSIGDFQVLASHRPSPLGSVAAEARRSVTVDTGDRRGRVTTAFVSDQYFETLGTEAVLGRLLRADDSRSDADPVVVIGDHFWRDRLGARTDVIGRTLTLDGRATTIVGVAPARFGGIQPIDVGEGPMSGVQVWSPLSSVTTDVATPWLEVFGRKAGSATTSEVESALSSAGAAIAAAFPGQRTNAKIIVRTFGIDPSERPMVAVLGILLFMAVPLCVMGIALANVINLQLARVAEQSRAIVVRLTLGASRAQAMRWLVLETMLLGVAAAVGALLLTVAAIREGAHLLPFDLRLNPAVIAVTFGLTAAAVLVSTWLPARLAMRRMTLTGTPTAAPGHVRLRHGLVVAQMAVSIALVLIAVLSARSLAAVLRTAPPDADRVQLLDVDRGAFVPLLEHLASQPDVETFGFSQSPALGGNVRYWLPGDDPALRRTAPGAAVTPGWLTTIGAQVLTGRVYAERDTGVAVVSEVMARRVADNTSAAIGQSLRVQLSADAEPQLVEIVGVVADPLRQADGQMRAAIYLPLTGEWTGGTAALRQRVAAPVMPLLQGLDSRVHVTPMFTLAGALAGQTAESRMVGATFTWIGAMATLVAFLGLAAVMTYMVQWRARELAIRGALGATPGDLLRLVVRQAARLVGAGAAVGLATGAALAMAMRSQLVGVSALDPVAVLATMAGFVLVGLAAAAWPARRAARTNPASLLR